jgi:hypothetical protein
VIVQIILDWMSKALAGVVAGLPPLPPDQADVLDQLSAAGSAVGSYVAVFSPIVPFGLINVYLAMWAGLVALWATFLLIRFVVGIVSS